MPGWYAKDTDSNSIARTESIGRWPGRCAFAR